jgi:L-seryl-tRNA(Ser) seleniumtransferase
MARALRLDKMTIAALEMTLRTYLDVERARGELPTLRLLTRTVDELAEEARQLAETLAGRWPELGVEVVETTGQVGGGALPESQIPSVGLALEPPAPLAAQDLFEALRRTEPPVIGRLEMGRLILDMRTLLPGEAALVADALATVGASGRGR